MLRCPFCKAMVMIDAARLTALQRLGRVYCDACFCRLWTAARAIAYLQQREAP